MAFLLNLQNKHKFIMKKHLTFSFLFLVSCIYAQNTYIVNNLSDDPTIGSGLTGSIRYCLNQANANTGLDTIKFSALTDNLPVIIDSTLRVYEEICIIICIID